MQELVNQSKAAPQSPSVPKQPGPPVMTSDPNMLSNEEATAHVSKRRRLMQIFFVPEVYTTCISNKNHLLSCSLSRCLVWLRGLRMSCSTLLCTTG